MHTEIQFKLPQQKELSYTEVFGAALPVYEEEYVAVDDVECGFTIERSYFKRFGGGSSPISLCSDESQSHLDERDFCRDDWEWLQEYGDISAAFTEKGELYECVDINEICCNLGVSFIPSDESYNGPTLAELNSGAMSPVVNPDMERLHFVALKTDPETTDTLENAYLKQRGYIRSPWINQPLRTSPWFATNLRSSSGVMVKLPVTNSPTADSNVLSHQTKCIVKESTDENQTSKYPEQNHHENLVQNDMVKIERSDEKENDVADGDESTQQYQDEDDDGRSSDAESHGSHENEHNNSDSEMEEEEDNYDTDNDEDFEDVYYQHTTNNRGRHSRKGRRKDTEDGVPNPKRLLDIGRQLEKLNSTISNLKPVHQLPVQIRNQTRREKNKLASRACRLKKKATHEANKIKLQGLAMEKERLLCSLRDIKRFLINSVSYGHGKRAKYDKYLELEQLLAGCQVAGNLHKFVESVLKSATVGNSVDCTNMF